MPKPIVEMAAHPFRAAIILAIALAALLVAVMNVGAGTSPGGFEIEFHDSS